MFRLILLFTVLPLVELSLLLRIGEWVGAGPTIGLVITTGVVGAWLARREGARTWKRVQVDVGDGRIPGDQLLHALLIFIAGVVLVTPGILTDLAGLILLVRPAREVVVGRIRERLANRIQFQAVGFGAGGGSRPPKSGGDPSSEGSERTGGRVIEVQTD